MWRFVTSNNDSDKKNESPKADVAGADGSEKKKVVLSREKRAVTKKDTEKAAVKKAKSDWLVELKRYLRGVVSEVKKVHWLGTREVVIYTIVVFVAVVFVGTLIWLFDSLLTMVLRLVM